MILNNLLYHFNQLQIIKLAEKVSLGNPKHFNHYWPFIQNAITA